MGTRVFQRRCGSLAWQRFGWRERVAVFLLYSANTVKELGQPQLAITLYKKALELEPPFKTAVRTQPPSVASSAQNMRTNERTRETCASHGGGAFASPDASAVEVLCRAYSSLAIGT